MGSSASGRFSVGTTIPSWGAVMAAALWKSLRPTRHSTRRAAAPGPAHHPQSSVSHSIFTRKFSLAAPGYQHLVELPTFGHSENHAGLQVCDIVCSALLYPIACFAYCTGQVNNVHVQPRAANMRRRYGQRLKALQYRYQHPCGAIPVGSAWCRWRHRRRPTGSGCWHRSRRSGSTPWHPGARERRGRYAAVCRAGATTRR